MHKRLSTPNLGHQPKSKPLRTQLALLVEKREPDEQIIVHHFTDTSTSIQLEYERRSGLLGVTFGRLIV